jgi:hypothetical protein
LPLIDFFSIKCTLKPLKRILKHVISQVVIEASYILESPKAYLRLPLSRGVHAIFINLLVIVNRLAVSGFAQASPLTLSLVILSLPSSSRYRPQLVVSSLTCRLSSLSHCSLLYLTVSCLP